MTEDLKRLLQATEGQGPAEEFVARLRAQIVAETEGPDAQSDRGATKTAARTGDPGFGSENGPDEDILVIDIEPPNSDGGLSNRGAWTHRPFRLLSAAAAAAAIVFLGVWTLSSVNGDQERDLRLETVDSPTTTALDLDGQDDGTLALFTVGNTYVDPGTYRIDTLGTPFTFSVEETTGMFLNANGIVLLHDLSSVRADDATLTLRRTSLLPDPADPTSAVEAERGWPAEDLIGWLEALSDEVTAGDLMETTLGGRDATFVELEVGELSCDRQPECVSYAEDHSTPNQPIFTEGSSYRVWVVDQGEEEPIVVVAAIDDESLTPWFDEADLILATVKFETTEPSPVLRAAAGPVELDVFGGISIDLPEDVMIVEPFEGFARFIPTDIAGDVEFLTAPLDTDGIEVTTTDRLLQLLTDQGVDLTELESPTIGGFDARTFEVHSGQFPKIALKTRIADLARPEFGWESTHRGHLWIVEHPESGLLIVSAETLDTGSTTAAALRPWTDNLLRGLEFRES